MTCRKAYDTDLTDPEWEQLEALVPLAKPGGRPPIHSRREILNGIFYAVRSGTAWKLLPHDLPPWRTVYHYFWSWRRNGTWQKIHDSIRASGGKQQADIRNRAVRSSTASQYRPLNKVAYEATMPPRTSLGANGTCWSIRSASCCWLWSRRRMRRPGQQRGYCGLRWPPDSGGWC